MERLKVKLGGNIEPLLKGTARNVSRAGVRLRLMSDIYFAPFLKLGKREIAGFDTRYLTYNDIM